MNGSRRTAAPWIFGVSLVARLPLAMLSIGLLVHVEHLTGSYATAGATAGALALAQGAGGPVLGRVVDRRGQTAVLAGSALVASAALLVLGVMPVGAPIPVLLALAALLGLATPPVGACLRTLLPTLVPDVDRQRRAYSLDAAATELTWVSGPPVVLLVAMRWGTGVGLVVAGAVLLTATVAFAAAPASRAWRSQQRAARATAGALQSPAMRVLVIVLIGVGVLFGATEVAVTAAADRLGRPGSAGLLLGLWGVGSLVGGLVAAKAGGGARSGRGLALLLAALATGHLALAPAAANLPLLAVVVVLAGTMIAPILSTAYAMVHDAAPEGTVTEAFTWMATATALGTSMGAAAAGAAAQTGGPAIAFLIAAAAAALAAAIASCTRSLPSALHAAATSAQTSSSTAQPVAALAAA